MLARAPLEISYASDTLFVVVYFFIGLSEPNNFSARRGRERDSHFKKEMSKRWNEMVSLEEEDGENE